MRYFYHDHLVLLGILKIWLRLRQFRETPMFLNSQAFCTNYIKLEHSDKKFLAKIPPYLFKKNNSKTLISKREVLKLHQILCL